MTKYVCVLCDEKIGDFDAWAPMNPKQYAHHECSLRSVVGGIGHQIAHELWCLVLGDPDAGLTYRQSALLVRALVGLVGIEEVSRRGASSPGVGGEDPAVGAEPELSGDDEWASEVVQWAASPEPPEEPPPRRS